MWSANEKVGTVESRMGKCGVQSLTYLLFDLHNDTQSVIWRNAINIPILTYN